jgi:transcriptional regulator with XRE-family HTH domain
MKQPVKRPSVPGAMGDDLDIGLLAEMVHQRRSRENLSLRDAATSIGTSAPTLQRVEEGQVPTTSTLIRLAAWLKVPLDDLRVKKDSLELDTVERIEVFLRADRNLDRQAAGAIADIVRQVYAAYAKPKTSK